MRPLVGITCGRLGPQPIYGVNQAYVGALQEAGADVVLLPPGISEAVLQRLDGLLLPGGPDVHPRHYGRRLAGATAMDEPRDESEMALVRAAAAGRRPLFGVCRGQQVVNVALGGSLHQDVAGHAWEGRPRDQVTHSVRIEAGTRLAAIAGTAALMVNSGHHQVVDGVAPVLTVSAVSPGDGYVEGLESADGTILTIQCHPEELVSGQSWARALFADFVARCSAGRP